MNLILGLGNPDEKYQQNRHNVGQLALASLAGKEAKFSLQKKLKAKIFKKNNLVLAKPTTYMNESGLAARALLNFYNIENLKNFYVIHDDLDLELGNFKLQFGKGPKGHNGLLSIYEQLGSSDFWHLRIGIDNRLKNREIPPEKYVLMNFSLQEQEVLDDVIIKALEELKTKIHA